MGSQVIIATLRSLHAKARAETLNLEERHVYEAYRRQLVQMLLVRQPLSPGQTARRALRVKRALPVKVDVAGTSHRSITVEISTIGFSTLLGTYPGDAGDTIGFGLLLPGSYYLPGEARIMNVHEQAGSFRVGCLILAPSDPDVERLEQVVFDEVLASFNLPG